jgi:hypothetical protein
MEAQTVRKPFQFPIALLLLLTAAASHVQAQCTAVNGSPALTATKAEALAEHPSLPPAMQGVLSSLASLPDADTLIFINAQRILNEVVPKFLPAKDVAEMRKGFAELKAQAGIDPASVEYVVIAVRVKKPTAALNFQAPEFMVVSGGGFSAESLLTLAHMAAQGKLRDEKYGDRTIGLMTIDPLVKEAEKNPFLKGFTEMGLVSLNANTIASGSPAYLRAAIDASGGKDRISSATLNSLVRDPNALVSMAGTPWRSFAKGFGLLGTEANARAPRCESSMGDFYAALTMDANNFMVRGAMNADNPDTAKIMTNLFAGFLNQATSSIPDPAAQSLLKGLGLTAEGDEVLLRADFPQQLVIDLIQQQMKPKQMTSPAVTAPPAPAKKTPTRRRSRRRG